jgi:hypothetical protein
MRTHSHFECCRLVASGLSMPHIAEMPHILPAPEPCFTLPGASNDYWLSGGGLLSSLKGDYCVEPHFR